MRWGESAMTITTNIDGRLMNETKKNWISVDFFHFFSSLSSQFCCLIRNMLARSRMIFWLDWNLRTKTKSKFTFFYISLSHTSSNDDEILIFFLLSLIIIRFVGGWSIRTNGGKVSHDFNRFWLHGFTDGHAVQHDELAPHTVVNNSRAKGSSQASFFLVHQTELKITSYERNFE